MEFVPMNPDVSGLCGIVSLGKFWAFHCKISPKETETPEQGMKDIMP